MEQGRGLIVCWQYWDTKKGGCYQSVHNNPNTILGCFHSLIPLCYWRIKSLKK